MPEREIHHADMERRIKDGPRLGARAVLVVYAGRMYKREGDVWYRLGDKCYSSVEEMIADDESA